MSNDIWVYIDLRNQRLFNLSMNILAAARQLAGPLDGKAVAIFPGPPDISQGKELKDLFTDLTVEQAVEDCLSKGADKVYLIIQNPDIPPFPETYAQAFYQVINERRPKAVFFPLTDFGRELAARCARLCNGGLIADCVDLRIDGGSIIAGCPSWGGEVMADLTFSNMDSTGFMTVQPHAFKPSTLRGDPGSVERIDVRGITLSEKIRFTSISAESGERRKLENAEIVVVGGAGMMNAENFGLVRGLSAVLGGEIGATRPPVLYHWVAEDRLIGQTGKSVRPKLLISVGTSGAIQYSAGIVESKTIIAINRDPGAPIFNVADVGIVADSSTFLPLLISRIKKMVMRDLADVLGGEKVHEQGDGFGEKVQKLRESHGWNVEELAQSTGQTPEFILQVEGNEVVPSVSFLLGLSKALGVNPGTFLKDEEKSAIQDQRSQAFIKRTKNYYYQTLTPGAENQHLRGFMITIEPRQAHKPVAYRHEGEEFIYVMEGSLELTLDNKVNHLKVGESIHFNSEVPHKLKNNGNETTRCLVILYTP
ncbi:MAG: FAD-binding protein [Deltaproteobacteria bacterium]|nr:FAD-binding protein [Deltaproteobacteria bacterium]